MSSNKPLTIEEVRQTFLTAFNDFGKQLQKLTEDLEAIEIITAIGPTTVNISSSRSDAKAGNVKSDITDLGNGVTKVDGNLTILARTRIELDGDLLVVLPIKQSIFLHN